MKKIFEVLMQVNKDGTADYKILLDPKLTKEEAFGMFESIISLAHSNEKYEDPFRVAMFCFAEKQGLLEMIGEVGNEVS